MKYIAFTMDSGLGLVMFEDALHHDAVHETILHRRYGVDGVEFDPASAGFVGDTKGPLLDYLASEGLALFGNSETLSTRSCPEHINAVFSSSTFVQIEAVYDEDKLRQFYFTGNLLGVTDVSAESQRLAMEQFDAMFAYLRNQTYGNWRRVSHKALQCNVVSRAAS